MALHCTAPKSATCITSLVFAERCMAKTSTTPWGPSNMLRMFPIVRTATRPVPITEPRCREEMDGVRASPDAVHSGAPRAGRLAETGHAVGPIPGDDLTGADGILRRYPVSRLVTTRIEDARALVKKCICAASNLG